jgi:hypothetical protein
MRLPGMDTPPAEVMERQLPVVRVPIEKLPLPTLLEA